MSNFEQPPIYKAPENSDVEEKGINEEEGINNEEKKEEAEKELNQEPGNIEAENQAVNDLFAESKNKEAVDEVGNTDVKNEEKISSSKGGFSRTLKNTLAGLTFLTAAANTLPAKSAEAEFTSDVKNKTEQLVSMEAQRQKMQIVEPNKVLSREELKGLADSLDYIDLYDLVELIQRRDPSLFKIDFDQRGNLGKIIGESDKHLIKGRTHIFVMADDVVTYFAQRSKVQNDRGGEEILTLSVNDQVERVALGDLESNNVKLIMATK